MDFKQIKKLKKEGYKHEGWYSDLSFYWEDRLAKEVSGEEFERLYDHFNFTSYGEKLIASGEVKVVTGEEGIHVFSKS